MTSETAGDEKRVDLVFEGGGVKGVGLAGAFGYLDEQGFKAQRIAGTSAGAITAALVAAGYSGEELRSLVLEEMKFKSFEDAAAAGRCPRHLSLPRTRGCTPASTSKSWMREPPRAERDPRSSASFATRATAAIPPSTACR